jgi:hypothetical protein
MEVFRQLIDRKEMQNPRIHRDDEDINIESRDEVHEIHGMIQCIIPHEK